MVPQNLGVLAARELQLTGQAPLHHRELPTEPCPTSAQAP